MSELRSKLGELDAAWHARGLPVAEWFGEGLERAVVVELLASVVSEPPDDVVAWFMWHDGCGSNGHPYLSPSGFIPLSLEEALDQRIVLQEEMRALAPVLERSSELLWSPRRFPLAWDSSGGTLAVELGAGSSASGPVFAIDVYTPKTYEVPAMADLQGAVNLWLEVLEIGDIQWDPTATNWEFRHPERIPPAAMRTGLVGF